MMITSAIVVPALERKRGEKAAAGAASTGLFVAVCAEQGARGRKSVATFVAADEFDRVAVIERPAPQKGVDELNALESPEETDTAPPATDDRREEAAIPAIADEIEARNEVSCLLGAFAAAVVFVVSGAVGSVRRTFKTTPIIALAAAGGKEFTELGCAPEPASPSASTAPLETPTGRESCEIAEIADNEASDAETESCEVTVVNERMDEVSARVAESPRGIDVSDASFSNAAVLFEEEPPDFKSSTVFDVASTAAPPLPLIADTDDAT
jgi:hypothetical protein